MSEEAEIDVETAELEAEPRKRFGLPVLFGAALLALITGAGAMYGAAKSLQKPLPDMVPLTARIESLTSENKTLKAQVTRLQRDVKAIPKPASVDVSAIENRLERLEKSEPQAIDPDLIARLEVLKAEGGSEALDLSDILARLEALEARPIAPRPAAAASPQSTIDIPFPSAEVLAALDKAEASQGWLKKSLKKHISVQSDDNPRFLLESVVQNIEAGNKDAAIAAFDKLPAGAKAVASEWRQSVESN